MMIVKKSEQEVQSEFLAVSMYNVNYHSGADAPSAAKFLHPQADAYKEVPYQAIHLPNLPPHPAFLTGLRSNSFTQLSCRTQRLKRALRRWQKY
jgi:hypothetical protein